jgi:hypothetical protein
MEFPLSPAKINYILSKPNKQSKYHDIISAKRARQLA